EEPIQEFVIAIAGPLVNFVIAILMAIVAFVVGQNLNLDLTALADNMGVLSLASIFNYVFVANLFLAIFNLIPAFPMDGGRVLRALLAIPLDYVLATRIAAAIGQTLALIMGLSGFLGGGSFFIILIAIFIYLGANQESQTVQARQTLKGLTVEQAYSRKAHTLAPQATLQEAIDLTLSSFQADFPVCEGGQLVGLLTQARLLEQLNLSGPETMVNQAMITDFKPASPAEEIFVVQQRMADSRLDALPVAENGRFLGLITNRDIGELYRLISIQPDLIERV
ncbi:MAG: site-2 protease family protein, partial [Anaerolineae bacterium]|nr:site-2 protease family protein [Anaerolineae bacterium]